MVTRILRRCLPLLGAVSLAAVVFFFWEAGRATPVFSAGGHQVNLSQGNDARAEQALLPTDTLIPPYPPPTDSAPPYPPPPTDTVVPPTATRTVPPTATRTVPPTSTRTAPPTATRTVPPTATRTVPPTATRTVPPTATPIVPPTATSFVPPTATPVVPPVSTSVRLPTATPAVPPSNPTPCSGKPGTYVVQRGDNLFRIAIRFDTTVLKLMQINRLWLPWIRAGQTLIIPGNCRPVPTPKPTDDDFRRHPGDGQHNEGQSGSHSGDDQSKKNPPTGDHSGSGSTDVGQKLYTVRAGDNLFRIGLRYGVSVSALQAANGLHSTYITVGQVLRIP